MKKNILLIWIWLIFIITTFIYHFLLNDNKAIIKECNFEKNDIVSLNTFFKNSWYNWNETYWCNLKKIKFNLWIGWNSIIPEIWKLNNLEYLDLSNKWLTWNIPNEIWNLSSLSVLLLQNNNLVWEIPNNIKKLNNLKVFNISDNNNLWWYIPIELFNLGKLNTLELINTKIKVNKIPENKLDIGLY